MVEDKNTAWTHVTDSWKMLQAKKAHVDVILLFWLHSVRDETF